MFQRLTVALLLVLIVSIDSAVAADDPSPQIYLPYLQFGEGGTISVERRMEILDSIRTLAIATQSAALEVDPDALLPFLRSIPELTQVEQSDASISGRFSDGRSFVIPLLAPYDDTARPFPLPFDDERITQQRAGTVDPTLKTQRSRKPASSAARNRHAANDTLLELPAGKRAFLEAAPHCFQQNLERIGRWLTEKNYEVTIGSADIPTLKNLGELGLFHFGAHGGLALSAHGVDRYALSTATRMNSENDRLYQIDIVSDRLTYMLAWFDSPSATDPMGCGLEWNYAITEEFVEEYLSFSANSLVWLDASLGAADSAGSLRLALYGKGATLIASWTDRMLARVATTANNYSYAFLTGTSDIPINPAFRPFDVNNIHQYLMAEGLDTSIYCDAPISAGEPCPLESEYRAILLFMPAADQDQHFGLLAPTIKTVRTYSGELDEGEAPITLEVNGLFGSVEGQVLVNDVELELLQWTPEQILAAIPANGAASAGLVTVVVDGHASNPVPLTEWRGRFRWEHDLTGELWPEFITEYDCDLHFRADFHNYRETLTETAITPPLVEIVDTENSQCSWSMSGETTDVDGSRHLLTGNGVMRWRPLWDPPEDTLHFDGGLFPQERQIQAQISGIAYGRYRVFNEAGEVTTDTFQPIGTTHVLTLELDGNWNIIGETERSFYPWGGIEHLVWWSDIEANFAPFTEPAR